MNKQRKVLITTTYNEMGIIIDTKAEEVAQPNLQPTCNQLATDTISRQAAIRWVKTECNPYGKPTLEFESGKKVIEHLEQMPSAQPEREKGNWVYGEDEYGIDGYHCDKCGFFVPWDYGHTFINYIEDYNFCPSCGAEMGEQDEQKSDDGI